MKPLFDESAIADIKTPIESVQSATFTYIKEKYGLKIYFIIAVVLILEVIVFKNAIPLVITFGAIFIFFGSIYSKIDNRFYQQIAELNGYSYEPKGSIDAIGRIFNAGYNRRFEDIITGQFENHPLKIFNYRFTTGTGKSRTEHGFTICELIFQARIPNIVLDAHNLQPYILFDSELKKLSLEGDFHKYFTLYCKPGEEIEALQIFTPDIMHEFIEKSKIFDLEFVGDRIYIVSPRIIKNRVEILSMFGFAHHIISRLKAILPKVRVY